MFFLSLTVKTKCNINKANSNSYFPIYCRALFLELMHKSTDLVACIAVSAELQNTSNALTWCIMLPRATLLHGGTEQRNPTFGEKWINFGPSVTPNISP